MAEETKLELRFRLELLIKYDSTTTDSEVMFTYINVTDVPKSLLTDDNAIAILRRQTEANFRDNLTKQPFIALFKDQDISDDAKVTLCNVSHIKSIEVQDVVLLGKEQ